MFMHRRTTFVVESSKSFFNSVCRLYKMWIFYMFLVRALIMVKSFFQAWLGLQYIIKVSDDDDEVRPSDAQKDFGSNSPDGAGLQLLAAASILMATHCCNCPNATHC